MKLYQFPPGGADLVDDQPRLVPVETVKALLPAATGDPYLEERLHRALRTQSGGCCYIGLSTEVGLLKKVAAG